MLAGDMKAVLDGIEAAFPVTTWRHGDLAIWPLARVGLMATAFSWASPGTPPSRTAIAKHRFSVIARTLRSFASAKRDPQHVPAYALRRACDMLLLSDGVSLTEIGDRTYERCCGPFADMAHELGASSLLLMPRPVAGRMSHRWHSIELQLHAAAALRRHRHSMLPAYDAAMDWVSAHGLHPLPLESLLARAERVLAWRSWYLRLLRRTRPRLVGITSFYEPMQMAMVAACRRLGITCCDIQHGMIGLLHGAYNGWTRAPAEGWELLPDLVWSWSDGDAPGIKDWSPCGRHAAIPGGNLLLDRFLAREDPRLLACVEAAHAIFPQAGRRILVTLQPGLDDASYYELLRSVITEAPEDWRFLIRLHPGHPPASADRLRPLFPGARCEMERSSRLPLYAVLDALGREAYGHLPGTRYATGTAGILSALAGLPERRRNGPDPEAAERLSLARATLRRLLAGRRA
jgi:hypothetical protein